MPDPKPSQPALEPDINPIPPGKQTPDHPDTFKPDKNPAPYKPGPGEKVQQPKK